MDFDCKSAFTTEEMQKILDQYRKHRAEELISRIKWKLNPREIRDIKNRKVSKPDLKKNFFWRLYYANETPKLTDIGKRIISRMENKLEREKTISGLDVYNLEAIYTRLNPMNAANAEVQARALQFVINTAKEDTKSGRFSDLKTALTHYGIVDLVDLNKC